MARPYTLRSALLPGVLAGAMALPFAVGAVLPSAVAENSPPTRVALTAAERAQATLTGNQAVADRLAQERLLARDVRAQQRAAAEAAARAAAEQAAAEKAAAERAAAEKAAADKAAAERRATEQRASRSSRGSGDPRAIARAMLADRGQADQFSCLDRLWVKESEWKVSATNPSSGAYGIPQALPAGKMASAGSDWRTNPATQIRWGIGYIADRYGSPCAAWRHSQRNNWY